MNTHRTGRTVATMLLAAAPVGALECFARTLDIAGALPAGTWTAAVAMGLGLTAWVSAAGRRQPARASRHGPRG
jgi:hypothetical protein